LWRLALAYFPHRSQRGVPRLKCTGAITWFAEHGQNDEYTLSILCKLLECGAGGGNRTIRAYSFYVTYCKHTNARTAQPAVCPPPMYKIMYNEIGRCGVAHRLRCYLSPTLGPQTKTFNSFKSAFRAPVTILIIPEKSRRLWIVFGFPNRSTNVEGGRITRRPGDFHKGGALWAVIAGAMRIR